MSMAQGLGHKPARALAEPPAGSSGATCTSTTHAERDRQALRQARVRVMDRRAPPARRLRTEPLRIAHGQRVGRDARNERVGEPCGLRPPPRSKARAQPRLHLRPPPLLVLIADLRPQLVVAVVVEKVAQRNVRTYLRSI
jgi:hypothetical protein